MYQFIETIRIDGGMAGNLFYHNKRMNETRAHYWPGWPLVDLNNVLQLSPEMDGVKCRVVYGEEGVKEVSYTPYAMRMVRSLRLVTADEIDYRFKSTDRVALDLLFDKRGQQDDVLIVKKGRLTDTSIANIALFDGESWYTPKYPLLKGTKRAVLLAEGIIKESEIKREDVASFSSVRLFNALINWGSLELSVKDIYD